MQKLSASLLNLPIISLRTGAQVGVALRPLINPDNLKIEGWFATSIFTPGTLLLPALEIREISRLGIAVNDHESITDPSELVRLKNVIHIDYQLLAKHVSTEHKISLGKVEDYSTDLESYYIQKLYVSQSMLKSLTKQRSIVSRTQIVEINDKAIIVKGTEIPLPGILRSAVREVA